MTVRYLDHAIRFLSTVGIQRIAPGLIDVDAFPQARPHLDGRTDWRRPARPEARLMRHCEECESGLLA